jgi:Holliday junction DNA helicase RuvA
MCARTVGRLCDNSCMIATLNGVVSEKLANVVVLDVAGLGYGLYVTNEDYGILASGQPAKVYVYEHIREQSHDLFGFVTLDTKNLFEQLLGVNGVGPKMALAVLSVGSGSSVRIAIAGGDTKYIQQASGVGKRVAERIVVELKDKVGLEGVDLAATGMLQGEGLLMKDEAALAKVSADLSTEERIKLALRG